MDNEIKHRGRKPKEPTSGFGANLRRLRTERGLNQTQLAEHVGVVQSHIANIECGGKSPSLDMLTRLSDFFGVGYDELMRETSDESAVAA